MPPDVFKPAPKCVDGEIQNLPAERNQKKKRLDYIKSLSCDHPDVTEKKEDARRL